MKLNSEKSEKKNIFDIHIHTYLYCTYLPSSISTTVANKSKSRVQINIINIAK